MAHEDRRNMSINTDANAENFTDEQQITLQKLADANQEIEELKLQIAWLECAYE